jgi:DNA primase
MDNILQEIKDRLNIADVIAGYIPIKKSGTNFKAPCPFHHEKTPSLMISPQKQIWHCFGCGEGGDVFGFVTRYENLDFKDALKLLADKAGVKLPTYRPEDKHQQDEKELLYRINNFAARYYHQVLMSQQGAAALEYLKNRGLSEATIKLWQIGFAPDDFHALERALATKKVYAADLVKAGVSSKNERGQMYDRFRGRITFPIYSYLGETVGFSARILNDDGKSAKYVNSPETIIYNKSKTLFGLNFAKESIRKKDEVVIVEGQMDCIAAHQAGFSNTVASSGTALNEAGLQQLGRLTKNLKFCFDADSAGQAASRRAGELALKNGFRVKIIILKNVKDPDELIKKSPGLWEKAVSEAVWFLDYYIELAETNFLSGSVEQKHYLSGEVVPFLQFIQDSLEQDHYIKKMSSKFSISEKVIRDQIKPANQPINQSVNQQTAGRGLLLQKEILGGLLFLDEFKNSVLGKIEAGDFEDAAIRSLVELVLSSNEKTTEVNQDTIAKEAVFMVESQLDDMQGDRQKLLKSLEKSFALFKLNALKRLQQQLQVEIKAAEVAGNRERLGELNQKFASIVLLRKELETNI